MKTYEVYRNIRKRAMIMGLPIALFALMMTSVIGSLLFIIFSFSWEVILAVMVFNGVLYVALVHMANNPGLLHLKKVFPGTISNKKTSLLEYE